ncbi:mitotic-spindle organizing protein 2 [Vespula squamosa]|uniref:Mitotic-spindle organizing protein 2 n=1 Tax=Vespula squamosa TaxID=30214 RepID=A0ABD2C726_VESSQ
MTFPQAHQTELIALADLAGITTTPGVFRIAIELLAMEISPEDIYVLLKQICPRTPSEETSNILDTQLEEDEKSEKS